MTRPFRFGVLAPLRTDLATWRDQVRRVADSGYSTLLMPDFPQLQPAPAPTLAMAASLADLRVGTWVYASPLRPTWSTAWEAHSLWVLTEGRASRWASAPAGQGSRTNSAHAACPWSHGASGWPRCVSGDDAARSRGPDLHTPVVMAVRGPKAQAVAAEVADTVAFALMPGEDRVEMTRVVRDFRAIRDVELAQQVAVIGDTVAPHLAIPDTDPAALRAADSLEVLPDDPAAAAEEIQRRREEIGFSYFVFGAVSADVLAPVVAKLAGR